MSQPTLPGAWGVLAHAVAPRSWTLVIPAPQLIASVNTGKHWRVTSRIKSGWRDAMVTYLRQARIPTGLTRIRVDIELRFPTAGRNRDASNYHPLVGKPLVDAMAAPRRYQIGKGKRAGQWVVEPGYGLIPDDQPKRHLHCEDCPHLRVSEVKGPRPYGQVVITITDLSEEES